MNQTQINPFETINNELLEIKNLLLDIQNTPKKEELPKHYSVQELSKLLNCSELSIYSYIKKGFLPASKIGRKYIIKSVDLENALKDYKSLKYRR